MTATDASPAGERAHLTRILGLPANADDAQIRSEATRLLSVLRGRLERHRSAGAEAGPETDTALGALRAEISDLEGRLARVVPSRSERAGRFDRQSLLGALLGAAFMLAFLLFYTSGQRGDAEDQPLPRIAEPARLILSGNLEGATLRVFDADRTEALIETEADGADLELDEGRYALDVGRQGCSDRWTRSVYFDAGQTLRFEPTICQGEGKLVVRSNVLDDRLSIDGREVGSTGAQVHTLPAGNHVVRVEKSGYDAFEATVELKRGETTSVQARLRTHREAAAERPLPASVTNAIPSAQDLPPPAPFDIAALKQELTPAQLDKPSTRLLRRDGLPKLPDGGSTAWHDRVRRELLTRFDADASGQIDRLAESESISCALWLEIEGDFDRGGLGLSMARYFGFDGTEWHKDALGFSRAHRAAAYAKMRECGLQP